MSMTPDLEAARSTATCPNCGAAVSVGAKFCGACGAEQPQACRACGATLKPGLKFCESCGTPVGNALAPATAPAVAAPAVCSRCGSPLKPGVKFCEGCGAAVEAAPAPPRQAAVAMTCTGCGRPLRPGVKFCGSCGQPAPAAAPPRPAVVATACARCGSPLKPGVKFCENCGAAVGAAPAPPPQAAAAAVCARCGSPFKPGVKFCGSCGQPVQAAAPSQATPVPAPRPVPQPAVAPTPQPAIQRTRPAAPPPVQAVAPPLPTEMEDEPVIGIIPGLERAKGFMKTEAFFLLVTPGRLVFALVPQAMMNSAIQQARASAKSQGRGMFGQVAAQMAWMDVVAERFAAMPVGEALAEEPGSFFIPNDAIRQAEITLVDFRREALGYYLVIDAGSDQYRFTLKGASHRDTKELLQQTLGDRVR